MNFIKKFFQKKPNDLEIAFQTDLQKGTINNDIYQTCYRIVEMRNQYARKTITLHKDRCYMCKRVNESVNDNFLCVECQTTNQQKNKQFKDCSNKVAIVTGGRIKIGYYTALRLLRMGATVIITTRFPRDAYERYETNDDYAVWRDRLIIIECDLLSKQSMELLIQYVYQHYTHIDYLINNAAQTIARPDSFYHLLTSGDTKKVTNIETVTDIFFPIGLVDEHQQSLDLRPTNSWTTTIDTVSLRELVDVMTINCVAPFYITQQLIPLLVNENDEFSYIINVSSMEGKFNRNKSDTHPHTNMAKASLNMMTKTCGVQLKRKKNIVMVSVDTGWNTIEEPCSYHLKSPLDCMDGASRVLDPILSRLTKSGVFYKDFKETDW